MPRLDSIRLEQPDGFFSVVARRLIVDRLSEVIRPNLRTIETLDPNAQVGFRGSLARGMKGGHKVSELFNPFDFDIDAFIVSDRLAGRFEPRKSFRSGSEIPEVKRLQMHFGKSFRQLPEFSGLRSDKFTFRIYTSSEASKMRLEGDSQTYLNP